MESYLNVRERIDAIRSHFGATAAPSMTAADRSFAQVLSTTGADRTQVPGVSPPRGYEGLTNGHIPDEMLVDVGNGHRLHPAAAVQLDEMAGAAAQDGVDLKLASSYRTVDHQERLVDELGLFSQGGLAAAPGHSNHGWGISVDLERLGSEETSWLEQNAAGYGWTNDVTGEPWHWTFTADPATMKIDLR
jgi:D-alanyl-D-alanine carboxypeptidase